ncbi:MAG TPA: FecR domain-containing protein [Polyangiales bacterium]
MKEPTKYAEYVVPALSSSRVDAQWERISEQLPAQPTRRRGMPTWAWGLSALAVVALAWQVSRAPRIAESVWEGSVVASDEAPVNLTLSEGTSIALDPRSRVSLMHSEPTRVQVSLTGGAARFDVAKKRARRFSVQLGQVEVLVTGTQFRVERTRAAGGERVRVEVEEGSVEVHRKQLTPVVLHAGDHWSAFVADDAAIAPTKQASAAADAEGLPSAALDAADSAVARQVEVADAVDEGAEHQPEAARTERRGRGRAASAAGHESAADLFEQANVARRSGRVSEAAQLFAELVDRHARDHRAALAAFELGRMRMDSLGDARGAIDALERALKLDARRAFAEDALARLVLAHEALGNRAQCAQARARYLARYPEGVHAQHIALRCGGN